MLGPGVMLVGGVTPGCERYRVLLGSGTGTADPTTERGPARLFGTHSQLKTYSGGC